MTNTRRISTLQWVKTWTSKQFHHENVVENLEDHFESNHSETNTRIDPVNILCLDGGGSRGEAHLALLEELSKQAGQDVLPFFDLVGGSSIGGVIALACNSCDGNTDELLRVGNKIANNIRIKSFKKLRLWNLLTKGYLENKKGAMPEIYQEGMGDAPLYNPDAMKAFALCSVRSPHGDNNGTNEDEQLKYEQSEFNPFVLRTYDMYSDALSNLDMEERESLMQMPGTNEVALWEALTATSAAPVLTNRIEMTVNGQTRRYGDGAVISNSPVAIAIMEARNIWPNRPLGVILSISLGDDSEDELIHRSIAAAQIRNPELDFLRVNPPCMKKYGMIETDVKVMTRMRDDMRSYVRESSEIHQLLDVLKKQHKKAKITRRKSRILVGSLSRNIRNKLSRRRHSVEEVTAKLNKIAERNNCCETAHCTETF